ncbi:MAG TPA: hypothetical protein PK715_13785, partial [Chitinophagales bacterium]|nr:hypothetical protein [Chitinophagales bacterium]
FILYVNCKSEIFQKFFIFSKFFSFFSAWCGNFAALRYGKKLFFFCVEWGMFCIIAAAERDMERRGECFVTNLNL